MNKDSLLQITNLHAEVDGQAILRGIDLTIEVGEVHAIMGPNASGKSTLANVLAGRPGFDVSQGEVRYLGQDLLAMPPEQRARHGLFLGFQYPVEIPGVSNIYLLKAALNAMRRQRGLEELDAMVGKGQDAKVRLSDKVLEQIWERRNAILEKAEALVHLYGDSALY